MASTTPPEFQRQLRSLFATLRTLVRKTVAHRESVEDFAAHLEGRIGCLARAHAMLLRAPPEGVDLHELVCAELLSQAIPEDHFRAGGPEIRIDRESAAPLALAFHELTMNALAFGTLARHKNAVDVSWQTVMNAGSEWLQIVWQETGLSIANPSDLPKGFGSELIERMLPYELGAQTTRDFTHDSLRVEFLIPQVAEMRIWQLCAIHPTTGSSS